MKNGVEKGSKLFNFDQNLVHKPNPDKKAESKTMTESQLHLCGGVRNRIIGKDNTNKDSRT